MNGAVRAPPLPAVAEQVAEPTLSAGTGSTALMPPAAPPGPPDSEVDAQPEPAQPQRQVENDQKAHAPGVESNSPPPPW